jgi:hypothetical protein
MLGKLEEWKEERVTKALRRMKWEKKRRARLVVLWSHIKTSL